MATRSVISVRILMTTIILLLIFYSQYGKKEIQQLLSHETDPGHNLDYKLVEMNDRRPSFKLATHEGRKPLVDGDRAQQKVVDFLDLQNQCHRDPSLIVLDVGAFLGDFGMYAAACGCRVFFFEVLPFMIPLIKKSIELNKFPSSRVTVIHKAVSDLPTGSQLQFSSMGGQTTVSNGSLSISTIRLDDLPTIRNSKIILLKIDVEGFELNVIRSAAQLFESKSIHHLIFEYTAWWTDRAPQHELLPYIRSKLAPKNMYALDRTRSIVYGPLDNKTLDGFYEHHKQRQLQTDIYVSFTENNRDKNIETQPYSLTESFA